MRSFTSCLTVALVVLATGATYAQSAATAPSTEPAAAAPAHKDKKKAPVVSELTILAKEVTLTPEQQTKLDAIVALRDAEVATYNTENEDKIKELKASAKEAKDAGDRAKAAEIRKQQTDIDNGRKAIDTKHLTEALALLTPEQLIVWDGSKLAHSTVGRLGKAHLSDGQKQDIRARADKAAAAMAAAADGNAKTDIRNKYEGAVDDEVLTAEQRELLKAGPSKKGTTGAAANPMSAAPTTAPAVGK